MTESFKARHHLETDQEYINKTVGHVEQSESFHLDMKLTLPVWHFHYE